MTPPRSIEEQFEHDLAQRFRKLQRRLELMCTTSRASDYFIFEAASCLDRGLVLATLQLCTSALELRAREVLVQYIILGLPDRKGPANGIEECVEQDRNCSFGAILAILNERELIDTKERQELSQIYSQIRIPLHHGIAHRYSQFRNGNDDETDDWVSNVFWGDSQIHLTTSETEMESVIEAWGAADLDRVTSGLELLTPKLQRLIGLSA
jgi:hypothetical protein